MGVTLVLMNFGSITNAESVSTVDLRAAELEWDDIQVDAMTNQEVNLVEKEERKIKEIKNFNQDLKRDYHKIKTSNEDTRVKYTTETENGETASIFIKNELYEGKKADNVIMTATISDGETGQILKFDAFESINGDIEPSLIMNLDFTENLTKDNEDKYSTFGFSFNGKAFQCSMVGLAACGQYCLVWGLAFGPGGAVAACGAICGTLMAAACATNVN